MAARPRIAVACPSPGERAALLEWLLGAGYEPVTLTDCPSIARALEGSGFEALIGDARILSRPEAIPYLRQLGGNRPIVIIGEDDPVAAADAQRRDITYLTRPLTREFSVLSIGLALAEGRPARRSPRQLVARIPATIDQVPATLIDVSYDGIRLEVAASHRSTLPPFFWVQVPTFRVGVLAQRVWVANQPQATKSAATVWCGAALKRNSESATEAWRTLVDNAPASIPLTGQVRSTL